MRGEEEGREQVELPVQDRGDGKGQTTITPLGTHFHFQFHRGFELQGRNAGCFRNQTAGRGPGKGHDCQTRVLLG